MPQTPGRHSSGLWSYRKKPPGDRQVARRRASPHAVPSALTLPVSKTRPPDAPAAKKLPPDGLCAKRLPLDGPCTDRLSPDAPYTIRPPPDAPNSELRPPDGQRPCLVVRASYCAPSNRVRPAYGSAANGANLPAGDQRRASRCLCAHAAAHRSNLPDLVRPHVSPGAIRHQPAVT